VTRERGDKAVAARSYARIIPLRDIDPDASAWVGAKALNLACMIRAGFPVPSGFCITVAAYKEHLERAGLSNLVNSSLGDSQVLSFSVSALSALTEAIIASPVCEDLTEKIAAHYRALRTARVAVRSSATAEDMPENSFAGLYETFLEIEGEESCIASVKRCWASLWTERAHVYREKHGFDHLDAGMAVIVQAMVPADTSGVMFTSDPRTGRRDRIIIEAGVGPGADFVSGEMSPDRFILGKRNSSILSHVRGLPDALPVISRRVARRLAKLAQKVESTFHAPQDIEWATSGRRILLLQSRPISALPPEPSWEDRQVWTNANAGEVAPDVVTPITWGMLQRVLAPTLASVFRLFCVDVGDNPVFGLVAGRAYFNINTGIGLVERWPERWNLSLDKALGGEQGKMYELGKLDIPEEDIPDVRFNFARMILRMPLSLCQILLRTPGRGELFVADMRKDTARLQNLNISAMSEEELSERVLAAIAHAVGTWNLFYNCPGFLAFAGLDTACTRWFGENGHTFAARLLAGMGDVDSAEAGLRIWLLARKAHELAEVETLILSGDPWRVARERINETRQGGEFLKAWDTFMAQHGHHCRGEIELCNTRWCENPDYILGLVRGYINCIGQTDPVENQRKHARKRTQLAQRCRQQLRNPIKRLAFSYLLRTAQRGCALRENLKSEAVRYMAVLRRMLLELGQRLSNRGVFAAADDIFFLDSEEIGPVIQRQADFDVKEVILARREEYKKNKSIKPPSIVIGKFDPDSYVPDAVDADVEVLSGLAVSPGVVTGKARVILKMDAGEHVLPGEILVAPFADPGWVPYFVCASGIVMDMGGLLSHGCIIAREYGIPTVVNVGPATKIIRTGQIIQVDGVRGIVRILK